MVAQTDLISTVPKRVATHVARSLPITIYDLPLPLLAPEFAMYWHPRNQDDAGHKWLREKIAVSCCEAEIARWRSAEPRALRLS